MPDISAVWYDMPRMAARGIRMSQKKKMPAGKKHGRKGSSALRQHKRRIVIIYTVLGIMAAMLAVNSVNLYARNKIYKQQEAELKAQIEEQNARSEKVKEYEEYVKTDDYIKDVAEEKLGLVDPNEILFRPEE